MAPAAVVEGAGEGDAVDELVLVAGAGPVGVGPAEGLLAGVVGVFVGQREGLGPQAVLEGVPARPGLAFLGPGSALAAVGPVDLARCALVSVAMFDGPWVRER